MIRINRFSLALCAVMFTGNSFAQGLPATDLWLAKIVNGVRQIGILVFI